MEKLHIVYVVGMSLDDLTTKLVLLIKENYEPLGGVVISECYHGKEYIQTMVKYPQVQQPLNENLKQNIFQKLFRRHQCY